MSAPVTGGAHRLGRTRRTPGDSPLPTFRPTEADASVVPPRRRSLPLGTQGPVLSWVLGVPEATLWREIVPAVGALGWYDYLALAEWVVLQLQRLAAGEIDECVVPTTPPEPGEWFSWRYACPRHVLAPHQHLYPEPGRSLASDGCVRGGSHAAPSRQTVDPSVDQGRTISDACDVSQGAAGLFDPVPSSAVFRSPSLRRARGGVGTHRPRPQPVVTQRITRTAPDVLPGPEEVRDAIEALLGVPYATAYAQACADPHSPEDLHALGEEYVWRLRRIEHGLEKAVAMPARLPRRGEFYDHARAAPRYRCGQ